MITKEQIAEQYQQIQNEICAGLELADGEGKFQEEIWNKCYVQWIECPPLLIRLKLPISKIQWVW